ncbi:hypothetical protein [Pseudomonas sp. TH05]|uniref:hypothetical protein n=1 Tax=Pseudomonas sp. TH05 TaxID=2796371 RepID=UPI00406CB6CC
MSINLTLQLASGQSLQGAPLELLSNGVAIARAQVAADGKVTFDTSAHEGQTGRESRPLDSAKRLIR